MAVIDPCAKAACDAIVGAAAGLRLWPHGDRDAAPLALAGAAGETLAFQLVLEGRARRLSGLRLDGAEGVRLRLYQNIALPLAESRWVDDALVPIDPAACAEVVAAVSQRAPYCPGRRRQTFTVELDIPQGMPPGRQTATLHVTAGGLGTRLEMELTVHPFALPARNACTADINNYSRVPFAGGALADTASPEYRETLHAYFRMAREHRAVLHLLPYSQSGAIMPGYAPLLAGAGRNRRIADWAPYDATWGPLLDGSAFRGCRGGGHPVEYLYTPVNLSWPARFETIGSAGYEREYRDLLRQMARHIAAQGWGETRHEVFFNHKARWKYYPWDMDEIFYERDAEVTLRFARWTNEATGDIAGARFVNRIDSSWTFAESARGPMADAIQLWVVNRTSHSRAPDEVARLRDKGQQVWFYGGAGALAAANRLENLKWPWIAWGRESDGFTWWNGLDWGSWERPGAGGGHCFYPGERFGVRGPLASLRLKVLFRAMQDHAYLALLTERGGGRRAVDAILGCTIGCHGREDWFQRDEGSEAGGADIVSSSTTAKPWNTASPAAWQAARHAVAAAIAALA